jgi:ribosomal protein L30E
MRWHFNHFLLDKKIGNKVHPKIIVVEISNNVIKLNKDNNNQKIKYSKNRLLFIRKNCKNKNKNIPYLAILRNCNIHKIKSTVNSCTFI